MTDAQPAIEWKPQTPELEPLRRLRDDPGRILLLIATALLLAGAFLPWAEGLDALQKPVAYTAQMAFAEGYILMVIALILGVLAGTRILVEIQQPDDPAAAAGTRRDRRRDVDRRKSPVDGFHRGLD